MKKKLTVIIPTYKEALNIPYITKRIDSVLKKNKMSYELLIVDDNSQDGTIETISKLIKKYPIRLLLRTINKGLSPSVIDGIKNSNSDYCIVMDADLSHPPENIPDLLEPIISGKSEFVIGSRFVDGGSALHFNWYRKLNAWISKMMSKPFVAVNDPMAGFFAFKRNIIQNIDIINPIGFKIGLEIMVKCSPINIKEVPIQFQERLYGESKLSIKEQLLYVYHIIKLFDYKYRRLSELILFAGIGTIGMIIDLTIVHISYILVGIPFRFSRIAGFILALSSNFILNRKYNFKKAKEKKVTMQYVQFFIVALFGLSLNWIISVYFFENIFFESPYKHIIASFIGILGGFIINFIGAKFIVFKK